MTDLIIRGLEVIAVAFAGSFIQRVSGFGFGIFAMIFLPHIAASYGEANALSNLISILATVAVAYSMRKYTRWKELLFPLAGNFILTILAVFFMKSQPETFLFILLGSVLILLSLWFLFFSAKVKIHVSPATGLLCGGLSGIMGGLFSMGGPPIVIYLLQSTDDNRNLYLAQIQTYFMCTNLWAIAIKAANGFVTKDVLLLSLFGIIGMTGGTLLGKLVFEKIDAATLRKIVYGFMAVSGAVNIILALI